MPILPNNDLDYIDEESEDITSEDMTDGSSVTENNATYNDPFDYNGPANIGVPDSLPVDPVVPESSEDRYYVTYYNRGDLTDYEPAYLQELAEAGCKFYAIYDDETEVEIQWTEIEDLDPLETEIDISASIADAANQHFWDDTNGVHVAEVAKEDWQTALEANFSDLSASKNYYNILMNSLGLLLRRANFILTSINRASISFYDGLGNETTNIMASFGRNSAQIGRSNDKHVVIDNSGLTAYNSDGTLAPLTGTFDGANINNSSITNSKIVDGTIEGTKIASATIDNSNIKNGTIEGTKIASATIDNSNIKNGTITGAKIADGTIENTDIKNGTITGAKIASATIENSNIKDGTIQGTKIVGSTLTGIPYAGISDADIEVARVANAEIAKAEVNYAHITNGVIDNAKIDHADVNGLSANYATVTNLNAATARIGSLEAADVTINGRIDATEADIDDLEAEDARIGNLVAQKASITDLNAATARIGSLEAADVTIDGRLDAAEADIDSLEAEDARIGNLVAQKASITALNAATARIDDLEADHVSVSDFEAEQANIDQLQANTADISTIRANSAKVENLTAAQLEADHATVGSLSTTYATIANLNAATGRISDLESTRVRTTDLEANYITADAIEAAYTKTDLSNTDVAWIQNGTIKNGAITNAMINSVSANKLTAGTIDASVINVTNLQADDISVTRINGQTVSGKTLVDALEQHEDDISDLDTKIDTQVEALNDRIDGAIETFTGTAVPTLTNSPASSWNTTKLKDQHVGDVYYVVNSNSQQNGYCYRFTKSGSSYSWQLIKDSDVTAALGRLQTAEGKISTIEQFDSDISSWKTDTDEELASIKSAATTLAGRVTTAEGQIATKVETSTFNTLSQTVNENSASISQLTTETTALTSKVESQNPFIIGTQTAQTGNWTGNAPMLSSLVDGQQITYWLPYAPSGNASLNLTLKDGSETGAIPCYYSGTVRLTTHYAANNAIHLTYRTNVSGIAQGWWADANYDTNTPYSKYSDTVVAGKNGLKRYTLCMRDDAGNFTSIVNQANNASVSGKTCYTGGLQLGSVCYHQTGGDYAAGANAGAVWESYGGIDFRYSVNGVANATSTELQQRKPVYLVGTIGADGLFYLDTTKWWTQTSFVEDKAYVFVGTAYSSYYAIFVAVDNPTYIYENGELVEIQTLQINKTTTKVNTVSDTVDEHTRKIGLLETSVESKADGSTVETMSTKLNTVSDTVDGHTQSISSINSTLLTKADSSTVSTLSTKVNTIEDTVDGHTQSLQSVTSTQTSIQQNAVKSTVQLWFTKANTTAPAKPTAHVAMNNAATGNAWNLAVPTYNSAYPNYYYCYEYQYVDGSYGWSAVTRDIATGEMQATARQAQSDIDNLEIGGRNLARGTAFVNSTDLSHWYKNQNAILSVEDGSLKIVGNQTTSTPGAYTLISVDEGFCTLSFWYKAITSGGAKLNATGLWNDTTMVVNHNCYINIADTEWHYYTHTFELTSAQAESINRLYMFLSQADQAVTDGLYINRLKLEKGNRATDWSPAPEDINADISTAQTSADNAQATADKNVKESIQLWFTKANGSAPDKPTSAVTSTSTSGNTWTTKVPTYNASYPHYFYCMQYKLADGTYTWSDVVYDQATTEAQSVARTTSTNLSTLQQDYATFKQTTQNFESTIGTTYATKTEVSAVDDKIDNLEIGGRNLLMWTTEPKNSGTNDAISGPKSTGWHPWQPNSFTITNTTDGIKGTFVSGNTGFVIPFVYDDAVNDEECVLSFDYRTNCTSFGQLYYLCRTSPNVAIDTPDFTPVVNETDWQHAEIKFKMGSHANRIAYALLYPYVSANGKWVEIKNRSMKLEKGNRATDWTPAPEDVDASIASVPRMARINAPSSNFTMAQWNTFGSMGYSANWSTGASYNNSHLRIGDRAYLTGTISDKNGGTVTIIGEVTKVQPADSGTSYVAMKSEQLIFGGDVVSAIESRVSSAETSITQTNQQIALKANASDVYTKTQTDGLISTEVSNRNSAIEQSASAINLSVSQNYTTKTEFNALEIGGRNLLKGTGSYASWDPSYSAWSSNFTATDEWIKFTPGENKAWLTVEPHDAFIPIEDWDIASKYTLSVDIKYDNKKTNPVYPRIAVETLANKNVGYASRVKEWAIAANPSTDDWTHFEQTFDGDYSKWQSPGSGTAAYVKVLVWLYIDSSEADAVYIRRLKLEKGNRATDWTPAPEDMVSQTEFESAKSEIKVTTDGITSTVEKINSAKYLESAYSGGSTLANIRNYASTVTTFTVVSTKDARVGDAVYLKYKDSTRNCYVYIKGTVTIVNSATTITLDTHGYEDVLPVDTIKSTINQSSDSVKIQAKHVEIDGAAIFSNTAFKQAADAAYDAKGSASAVQTNLDNLEIGGRNFLLNTENPTASKPPKPIGDGITWQGSLVGTLSFADGVMKLTSGSTSGEHYIRLNSPSHTQRVYESMGVDIHDCLVLSGFVRASVSASDVTLTVRAQPSNGSSWVNTITLKNLRTGVETTNTSNVVILTGSSSEWVRFEVSIYIPESVAAVNAYFSFQQYGTFTVGDTIEFKRLKLERGTRATDWSPAPEDVNTDISAAESSAKGYADTKKTEAISAAATDATNKANAAEANANSYSDKLDSITTLSASYKKFKNPVSYDGPGNRTGALIITTPITDPYMVLLHLNGYNYSGGSETIDMEIGFYNYSSNFHNYGYVNYGTRTITPVRLAKFSSTDKRAVIIIGDVDTTWSYPKIVVSEVSVMHSNVPDSFADGWFMQLATTLPTTYIELTTIQNGTDFKKQITDVTTTANNAASKSSAVARTQRIYWRATSNTKPSANTTWLATSGDGYGNWSLNVPQLTKGTTKYPYLFTAVQTQTVAQQAAGTTCTCSAVMIDDSTTVIDGGKIITGSVSANAINASSGTFDTANIPDLNASKITAGNISADRIKTNVVSAIQAMVTDLQALVAKIGGFTLDATSIRTAALTSNADNSIGLSTADFTRTINGTSRAGLRMAFGDKFGVTGDGAIFASSANVSGTITATAGTIGGASISNGVLKVKDANIDGTISGSHIDASSISIGSLNGVSNYATKTDAQGYANAKDDAIAAAAKRTDVAVAVTAIDYNLGTATLQATLYIDGTATTSNVTYKWLKDGSVISGQTARTLSVTAAMGLSHVYSCTVTYS